MSMKIYVDESGNGGMLDPKQPVIALSAIVTDDATAKKLREEFLPEELVGEGELKHERLCKRLRGNVQERLCGLQEKMLSSCLCYSYVFEKKFFLIERLLMDVIPGESVRVIFLQQMAMEFRRHYDEIDRMADLGALMKAYVRACRIGDDETPDTTSYEERFSALVEAARSAVVRCPMLRSYVGGLADRDRACEEEFKSNTGKNAHAPMLWGLLNAIFEERQDDAEIICDESPQYHGVEKIFGYIPRGSRIQGLRAERSATCIGIQLADLLAGGARLVGERRFCRVDHGEKLNSYVSRLGAAYDAADRLLYQPPLYPMPFFARDEKIAKNFGFDRG